MAKTLISIKNDLVNRGIAKSLINILPEWINQAYDIMWDYRDWNFKFVAPVDLSIISGTSSYTLANVASDVSSIPYMYDPTNDVKLTEKKLWEILEVDPDLSLVGTPKFFYLTELGTKFGLFPIPDSSFTMKVPYYKVRPDLSSDTDKTILPDRFDRILVDGAHAIALDYDNDPRAQRIWNKFYYGDPGWSRGRTIKGGLVGIAVDEDKYRSSQGFSQYIKNGVKVSG